MPNIQADIQARIEQEVKKHVLTAWQEIGRECFDQAQLDVPVDTGYLKSTGTIVNLGGDSILISYKAPYAREVEFGREAQVAVPYVTTYMGKTKGGTRKQITRTYLGKKPVYSNKQGKWITVDTTKKREGKHFLYNALFTVFQEMMGTGGLTGKIPTKIEIKGKN